MKARRISTAAVAWAFSALTALIGGCGDDSTTTSGCRTVSCAKFGAVGDNGAFPGSLCSVSNDAFCADTSAAPASCSELRQTAVVEVCGVGLPEPSQAGMLLELQRSDDVKEYAGAGAPDLGCWQEGGFPAPPAMSEAVTMSGIVKIFKNGCESDDVTVEVYTVKRDGSDEDGMPDQKIGEFVTPATCDSSNAVEEVIDDCTDNRWECTYSIEGVPTETELLIITSGEKWQQIYEYNVYFSSSDVVDGQVEKDVRALDKTDYPVIAQAAIGRPVTSGRGALAGEVHDCGDVRLENAIVDVNVQRAELTYFGSDEDDPLPDLEAKATGRTALYSALDISPGPVTVAAAGVSGGALLGIGFFHARVFPDAVTSVTFRGLRPFQVP